MSDHTLTEIEGPKFKSNATAVKQDNINVSEILDSTSCAHLQFHTLIL